MVLSVVSGWVIRPAFAYLLTMVIPMDEPCAISAFRINLAPDVHEVSVEIAKLMFWSELS